MAGEVENNLCLSHSNLNLQRLRDKIRLFIDRHNYESALFWADKMVSLSKGEVQDIFWHAQTLYLTAQYHRAAHLIRTKNLDKRFLACRYLAARCHFDCKEYEEAMEILDPNSGSKSVGKPLPKLPLETHPDIPSENMESSISLLRGKVYEAMDNRNLAAECFKEALRADVFCHEAFHSLVNHHMMTSQEERDLLDSLPLKKQCSDDEIQLLTFLFENKLKKYDKPGALAIPGSLGLLDNNLDVVVSLAERHYYNCDFRACYKISSEVLSQDPFNSDCLPLHVAVLVELRKANELFYLAHKLVDMYPNKAVAWFAVGCYYLLVGKNDPSRRYLSKATTLDRVYGPAWLAFGHSFAAENEHDQAMAAYFTASQLMKGCHLPVLYIGLEYGLTNNAKLAEKFFSQALSIAPEDPFVLHEMGVVAFQNQDFQLAEDYLKSALEKVQVVSPDLMVDKWEPLLNNLGHVCRKLKKHEEALGYYRRALILSPHSPSTLSAIGYVHALMGRLPEAVDYLHKALGLRRDDTFSRTMLDEAVEQLMADMAPCDGAPDVVPEFTTDARLSCPDVAGGGLSAAGGGGDCGEDSATSEPLAAMPEMDDSSLQLEAPDVSSLGDGSSMTLDTEMEDV